MGPHTNHCSLHHHLGPITNQSHGALHADVRHTGTGERAPWGEAPPLNMATSHAVIALHVLHVLRSCLIAPVEVITKQTEGAAGMAAVIPSQTSPTWMNRLQFVTSNLRCIKRARDSLKTRDSAPRDHHCKPLLVGDGQLAEVGFCAPWLYHEPAGLSENRQEGRGSRFFHANTELLSTAHYQSLFHMHFVTLSFWIHFLKGPFVYDNNYQIIDMLKH